VDGLIKTPEQMAAEQQQAQMMKMASDLGPSGIKSITDLAMAAKQQPQSPDTAPEQPQ
jgi:hypothetical protein